MRPQEFFEQRTVKLIEFAIDKRQFTIQQALNASKMRSSEFLSLADIVFTRDDIAHDTNRNEVLDWHLKPDVLFGYLALLQYTHSIKASRRAIAVALISVAVTVSGVTASLLANIAFT